MSDKYKMYDKEAAYFVTLTIVDWIDVFTRLSHKLLLLESLKYCQKFKGLEIYGWCLMTNHLHMIAKAVGRQSLPEVIRDFKKFTSKAIIKQIIEQPESRRCWMLGQFEFKGRSLKRIEKFKFWQDGNHAEIIVNSSLFYQKLNYIHKNPVKEMIVAKPEDYCFSSARDYAGIDSLLDIVMETQQLVTYK